MKGHSSQVLAVKYKYEYALFLGLSLFLISFFSMSSAVTQSSLQLLVALLATVLVMFVDTVAMYPIVLRKLGYLSHHIVAGLGCLVALFFLEELSPTGIGLIGYTALGAAFRRMLFCSRKAFPQIKSIHRALYLLQLFFDFCDLLVIVFFWDIISNLPILFQLIFYSLVAVRYYINTEDLAKTIKSMKQI